MNQPSCPSHHLAIRDYLRSKIKINLPQAHGKDSLIQSSWVSWPPWCYWCY